MSRFRQNTDEPSTADLDAIDAEWPLIAECTQSAPGGPRDGPDRSRAPGASLRDVMARMGHDSPRAALIYQHASAEADRGIADAIELDALDRKWEVDGPALLVKLRALTFSQEVALLEQIEAWWARSRQDHGQAT